MVVCACEERAKVMFEEFPLRNMPVTVLNVTDRAGLPQGPAVTIPGGEERLKDRRVVVYQGVLAKERCLENLVSALKHLPQDVVLLLVGDGAVQGELKRLARVDETMDRLIMTGRVPADHVVSYMRLAHVGVVIYRNTCRNNILCSPNKLYDYCAIGLPVAGSDQTMIRSVVEGFGAGAVFDPESGESIAAAIMDVLEDETRRSEMARRAASVKSVVNWEGQTSVLLDAYDALIPAGG